MSSIEFVRKMIDKVEELIGDEVARRTLEVAQKKRTNELLEKILARLDEQAGATVKQKNASVLANMKGAK